MAELNASSRAKLKARMKRIPDRVKRAAGKELERSANLLVAQMKFSVPVEDGTLRSTIRQFQIPTRGVIARKVVAGGDATTVPVRQGADASYDYAMAQEFGTEKMAANPFFFPVWRRNRTRIRARVTRAIKKSLAES